MSSAFATSFRLKLIWVWFQDRGSEFSLRRTRASNSRTRAHFLVQELLIGLSIGMIHELQVRLRVTEASHQGKVRHVGRR